MITGELKGKIDKIWDAFWSRGIANPMNVIKQFTYLIFLRQLDKQLDTLDAQRAFGKDVPASADIFHENQQDFRWKNLVAETSPTRLKELVEDHAFPHMKDLGSYGMAAHMRTPTLASTTRTHCAPSLARSMSSLFPSRTS